MISMSTPSRSRTLKRSSMTSLGRPASPSRRACSGWRRVGPYSPASLAQKLLTPSQAITTPARTSPSGRSVRTPTTRRSSSRSSPVTVVDVTSSAPSASALPASQWSKSGRNAVAPLYGGRPHASLRKSTVSACVVGEHHRRAAGDPPLHRRLLPPLRVEAVEDPRVDDAAVHVLAAGERAPLEQQHRAPGAGEHRRRARPGGTGADDDDVVVDVSHRRPADAGGSSSSTALASATTARSAICIIGQCGSMLTLTTCVGRAEAGGVLDGAADAEGDVQRRVDDDAGRADLALVLDPAAVGDHPGGAHRRAERGGDVGAAGRSGRRRRARRRRRRCGRPRRGPSS